MTGDKDFPFCFANCYAVAPGSGKTSQLDDVQGLYPAVGNFSTYIPANTGYVLILDAFSFSNSII